MNAFLLPAHLFIIINSTSSSLLLLPRHVVIMNWKSLQFSWSTRFPLRHCTADGRYDTFEEKLYRAPSNNHLKMLSGYIHLLIMDCRGKEKLIFSVAATEQ